MQLKLGVFGTGCSSESLPFDISRTRSWPVTYSLAEDASNSEVNTARKKLADDFYLRLRPFLGRGQKAPEEEFERILAKRPPAFWFEKKESLGTRRDEQDFWMPFESVVFIRLIPTDLSQRLIAHELAGRAASQYGSFDLLGDLYILRNDDGAAMCELDGQKNVSSIAQYFTNGEIWGLNAVLLRLGGGKYLLMKEIEKLFRAKLPRFLDCMTKEFAASLPIKLIAGVSGIKGRLIAWDRGPPDGYSKMIKASVEHERSLNRLDQATLDEFLLELFEKIFEASGKPRPKNFSGFPPS